MNADAIHNQYLNNLIRHLDAVGIQQQQVAFTLKEPEWWGGNPHRQLSLCDLIIGHKDGTMSALELKGSAKKYEKALRQIHQGKEFIEHRLNGVYRAGIFAVYVSPGKYHYEMVY